MRTKLTNTNIPFSLTIPPDSIEVQTRLRDNRQWVKLFFNKEGNRKEVFDFVDNVILALDLAHLVVEGQINAKLLPPDTLSTYNGWLVNVEVSVRPRGVIEAERRAFAEGIAEYLKSRSE